MERKKLFITPETFLNTHEEFLLVYALNTCKHSFRDVVSKLNIRSGTDHFFCKGMETYSEIVRYEKIIEEILTAIQPVQYKDFLHVMHRNAVFNDHIMLLSPECLDKEQVQHLSGILFRDVQVIAECSDMTERSLQNLQQTKDTVHDFSAGVEGLYCFVLLQRTEYASKTDCGQRGIRDLEKEIYA
jgi:hypothetical protein